MSIITAAPWTEFLGTRDGSTRERVITATPVPSHLPLIYTYAAKGDSELNLVAGDSALYMYGDEIFDVRSKFATHQTVLANELNAVGNALMIKRVIPKDAPAPANVRISIELVKTKVDPGVRDANGHFILDQDGQKQLTNTEVDGYIAHFIAEHVAPGVDGATNIGKGSKRVGTLVGPNGEESQRIPLMDFEASSQGSWGNLQGVRIWSADVNSMPAVNDTLVRNQKAYPYYFTFVAKATPESTARVVYADTGEQYAQLTLKPDTFDSNTDTDYYVGNELLDKWAQQTAATQLRPSGPFGKLHVYEDNMEEVHELIATAEKEALKAQLGMPHDLAITDTDDSFRVNLFGAYTTQGAPYLTYQIEDSFTTAGGERVARFSEMSNIMATGGGDGTMSPTLFAELVAEEVQEFGDRNSKYQDLIRYPVSVFYDTGFPMTTKKALGKLISVRKDIALALVPSVYGEREPAASEESSICIALRTIMQAYAESVFFGTSVMRGLVFAHTGKMLSSRYKKRAPLVIEAARKFGRYMGASNGIWRSEYSPDSSANNRVEYFADVSAAYKPAAVRNRDWKAGMIWVDACDLTQYYWPALRTVYEDDSSVLTSAITVFAICELEKIGERVRTEFSGNTKLTNGQLKDRIEARVNELVQGRFDDRFEITPTVDFTRADIARGYSWLLKISIRANNMKTAQTLYIEALRYESNDEATTSMSI